MLEPRIPSKRLLRDGYGSSDHGEMMVIVCGEIEYDGSGYDVSGYVLSDDSSRVILSDFCVTFCHWTHDLISLYATSLRLLTW